MSKCVVCKQDVDVLSALYVDGVGYVHQGECSNHLQEMAVVESSDNTLNETELLL